MGLNRGVIFVENTPFQRVLTIEGSLNTVITPEQSAGGHGIRLRNQVKRHGSDLPILSLVCKPSVRFLSLDNISEGLSVLQ